MKDKFGYSLSDWDKAKKEMKSILVERAKQQDPIAYSELTAQVHAIRFAPQSPIFAHMLGEVSKEEDDAGRGMLTALVVHKHGEMKPGPGFFELAKSLGKDVTDIDGCWIQEIKKAYDYWSKH